MIPIVVQPEVIKELADCIVDIIQNKIDWNSIDWQAVAENQRKNDWIPVSERLPDKNGNYLCTVDYGENGVVVTQRNYWDTLGGFDKGYNKNDKVIAWQPLPEPYMKGR